TAAWTARELAEPRIAIAPAQAKPGWRDLPAMPERPGVVVAEQSPGDGLECFLHAIKQSAWHTGRNRWHETTQVTDFLLLSDPRMTHIPFPHGQHRTPD